LTTIDDDVHMGAMKLSDYLQARGLSQRQFSKETGIEQSQLSRWMAGRQDMTLPQALTLLVATKGRVGLVDMLHGPPPPGLEALGSNSSEDDA
jgi:predicted XRE-type DNA-binding protein